MALTVFLLDNSLLTELAALAVNKFWEEVILREMFRENLNWKRIVNGKLFR